MSQERSGPVGGLAADRPFLSTLVLAFGLTAIAVAGAAAAGEEKALADMTLAGAGLVALPLLLACLTPDGLLLRALAVLAFAGLGALYYYASPLLPAVIPSLPGAVVFAAVAGVIYFALLKPLIGPALRFVFVSALAAALGVAGVVGLMALEGLAYRESFGVIASLSLGAGVVVGAGVACDFVAYFSRGAEPRRAAGAAARHGTAPAVYCVYIAVVAVASAMLGGAPDGTGFLLAWLAGAGAVFAGAGALFVSASAAALAKEREDLAVTENRRTQTFRRLWRPFRNALPYSAGAAMSAIAAVALLALLFEMGGLLRPSEIALILAAGLGAGVVFLSLRTAFLVTALLAASVIALTWVQALMGAEPLSPLEMNAVIGLAAMTFSQLGLVWRDARSPRLNVRETTEAAMCAGTGRHALCAGAVSLAALAGWAAGEWENGLFAAVWLAAAAFIGLVLAPPFMTALAGAGRRGLAGS